MANKKGLYEKYIFDNFYLADESNKYLKNNSKIRLRDFKNIFSHKNDYKFLHQNSQIKIIKSLFLGTLIQGFIQCILFTKRLFS